MEMQQDDSSHVQSESMKKYEKFATNLCKLILEWFPNSTKEEKLKKAIVIKNLVKELNS
jgi:hypothetical protein